MRPYSKFPNAIDDRVVHIMSEMSTVSTISEFLSIQDCILTPFHLHSYNLIFIILTSILHVTMVSDDLESLAHIDQVIHSVFCIGYVFVI